MRSEKDSRDQVAYLRQLAVESLSSYSGGFIEQKTIDRDLKSIIRSLGEVADPSWASTLLGQWGYLEAIYASALVDKRFSLTLDEELDIREVVAKLLGEFERYVLPLSPGEKPREHDIVRLLRPFPEHHLQTGSIGTVVVDYTEYSDGEVPAEYEVEFAHSEGITEAMVTVPQENLEVVWRPDYGGSPR